MSCSLYPSHLYFGGENNISLAILGKEVKTCTGQNDSPFEIFTQSEQNRSIQLTHCSLHDVQRSPSNGSITHPNSCHIISIWRTITHHPPPSLLLLLLRRPKHSLERQAHTHTWAPHTITPKRALGTEETTIGFIGRDPCFHTLQCRWGLRVSMTLKTNTKMRGVAASKEG